MVSKAQMYDFVYPLAGMFLWMHVHFETHPLFDNKKVPHARLARALWVWNTTEPWKCLIGPGSIFCPTDEIRDEKGWQYFRLCFAAVDDNVVEKYSKDVVGAFQSFWQIEDPAKIDEILEDDDKNTAVEDLQGVKGFAINPIIC